MSIYVVSDPPTKGNVEKKVPQGIVESVGGLLVGGTHLVGYPDSANGPYDACSWLDYCTRVNRELLQIGPGNGDTIIFAEWIHFGLEWLIPELRRRGKNPRVVGFIRGASFLPGDFASGDLVAVAQEEMLLELYNTLWVQTNWVKENSPKEFRDKMVVVGSPFDPWSFKDIRESDCRREFDVAVCTRLAPDKGLKDLTKIVHSCGLRTRIFALAPPPAVTSMFPRAEIVVGLSGEMLWKEIRKCKFVLSAAVQETWGYSVLEAVAVGCIPVVPDRASYKELYPERYRYKTIEGAVEMLHSSSLKPIPLKDLPQKWRKG